MGLEFQRQGSHRRETSHWDVAYLVIAVVIAVPVAFADGGIHPPATCVMTPEEVVKVHAHCHFLHTQSLAHLERAVDAEVGSAVARQ